ncbi:hypothetical protein Tco_1447451 [Tanacetum coccineum]
MFGQNSSNLVLHLDDVWTKQFKPRSLSNDVCSHQFKPRSLSNDVCSHQFRPRSSTMDVVWTKQFKPRSSSNDVWTKQFKPPKDAVAREVHATHARIVSGPDPEPVQEDQTGDQILENYIRDATEVKKTDLSADVLASQSNPEFLRINREILCAAWAQSHQNQESEKSPMENFRIIREEQGEEKPRFNLLHQQQTRKLSHGLRPQDESMKVMMKEDDDDEEGPSARIKPGLGQQRKKTQSLSLLGSARASLERWITKGAAGIMKCSQGKQENDQENSLDLEAQMKELVTYYGFSDEPQSFIEPQGEGSGSKQGFS